MNIRKAIIEDIQTIQNLVEVIWPFTYGQIISEAQIDYMLMLFYSNEALLNQFQNNQDFYIISSENVDLGFIAIEHNYSNQPITKIHKLYVLPENQGKGIGQKLLSHATQLAIDKESKQLILNVNKFNSALLFYQKQGFTIQKEEDISIGNGYLMEDYVLQKNIQIN